MSSLDHLSSGDARRIALAAQGFDRPRPRRPIQARHISDLIRRLGLVQLDFANVLLPAHYMVPFSRLGPYNRSLLDEAVYRSGEFTEQWAHEASIIPVETWPLLRHRMETHRVRPWGFEKFLARQPEYVALVLDEVRRHGPLATEDLPHPEGDRRIPGSWVGTVARAVLEAHFGRGLLAIKERRSNFSRLYDLAERLITAEHCQRQVTREHAQRELLRTAARAQGVATAADLADYFRMPVREARPRIMELVESGELRESRVENWRETAFLHRDAVAPRDIDAMALLAPFDPLIWFRPRIARLFNFDYRFEIFVPPAKRKWGSYVLPFLLGDRLVARVDLKADRASRRLIVVAAYFERGASGSAVLTALASELRLLARWLALDSVFIAPRGDLARALAAAVKSA